MKNGSHSTEFATEADSVLRTLALSRERVRVAGESVFILAVLAKHPTAESACGQTEQGF